MTLSDQRIPQAESPAPEYAQAGPSFVSCGSRSTNAAVVPSAAVASFALASEQSSAPVVIGVPFTCAGVDGVDLATAFAAAGACEAAAEEGDALHPARASGITSARPRRARDRGRREVMPLIAPHARNTGVTPCAPDG